MKFIERRYKISLQLERTNLYDDIQDLLIDQDVGEDEYASVIQGKLIQHNTVRGVTDQERVSAMISLGSVSTHR